MTKQRRTPKHARIAIVGAGIAGLNAALALQDAGLPCNVYEASNRIGGRMHSDTTTWPAGMVTEWCGEFTDSDHETTHGLIRPSGLHTLRLLEPPPPTSPTLTHTSNHHHNTPQIP